MKAILLFLLSLVICVSPPLAGGQEPGARRKLEDILKVDLLKSSPQDEKLHGIQVQRFNEIATEYRLSVIAFARGGPANAPDLFDVSRRLVHAAIDFDQPRERIALLLPLRKLAQEQETVIKAQHKAQIASPAAVHRFRSLTLEIDIHLVRAESNRKLER